MDKERTVKLGKKDGYLITTFDPTISENKLFEATTSAFSIKETITDKENDRRIWGVMYHAGDQETFDNRIEKLREEIEENTGYSVADKVLHLGKTATKAETSKV